MLGLRSLTNRIFLASTLLAAVSIGGAVYLVSERLTSEAESDVQRDLAEAATLLEQQRVTLAATVSRTARLVADLPKFKAAIETADVPTVAPIALDYQRETGADLLLVTDARGRVLADLEPPAVEAPIRADDLRRALGGQAVSTFWPAASGLLQVVVVPVAIGLDRPEVIGTLALGYLLDDARAREFRALTGAEIAFALGDQVRASSLGAGAAGPISALLTAGAGPAGLTIAGEDYAVLHRPLTAEGADGGAAPQAVVLQSRTRRMRTLAGIRAALGGIALLTMVLAAGISYLVARTVTRPLATLTDHMRDIAATGDLTRRMPEPPDGWRDEDAELLASTFATLTDSLATFQREAAQRDRLSSLGRLSTVIAHEIRNPLMIIKGALRQVAKDDATPADVREAAADIDEEVQRLNRVVEDVLDFARPIRFACAPADLNAVCRSAAAAIAATHPSPPVTLALDAAAGELVTDAERLRMVLVNLLANAHQALDGRPPGRPAQVVLTTARQGARHVRLAVRDTGRGIAPDDLPRIFDPYFTTRRAGTGLGLAIAKNVVEGLGGTIAATSTPGDGTEIRIVIGDAHAGSHAP
jgi:signal transduction histidine kinase